MLSLEESELTKEIQYYTIIDPQRKYIVLVSGENQY